MVPIKWVEEMFTACLTGNYDKVDEVVDRMSRNGLPASKVLDQFFHFSLNNDQLTDAQKAIIFQKISVSLKLFRIFFSSSYINLSTYV